MKTNPIGVRFRKDLLEKLEQDGIADTPQKVLNFLTDFYHEHDPNKINFAETFKNSKLFDKEKKKSDDKQDKPQFKNDIERKLWEIQQEQKSKTK